MVAVRICSAYSQLLIFLVWKSFRKTWIGLWLNLVARFLSVCVECMKYDLVSPEYTTRNDSQIYVINLSVGFYFFFFFDAAYQIRRRFFILHFEWRAAHNENVFERTLWMLHTKCAIYINIRTPTHGVYEFSSSLETRLYIFPLANYARAMAAFMWYII